MRNFGVISTSIWRSKRFRMLACDLSKLVYMYLHTTTHGTSAGVFVNPPELAALEMRQDAELIRDAYEELSEVGLIRYDSEEEMVQIVGFFKHNGPTSRKHLAGPLAIIYNSLPQSFVRDAAAIELVASIYERALTWDVSVEARAVFLSEAAKLIKNLHLEDAICDPKFGLDIGLLIGLSEDLLIDLPIQREKKKNTTKTKTTIPTKTTTKTITTTKTKGPISQDSPKTEKTGRKPPDDVQKKIDALTGKNGVSGKS